MKIELTDEIGSHKFKVIVQERFFERYPTGGRDITCITLTTEHDGGKERTIDIPEGMFVKIARLVLANQK